MDQDKIFDILADKQGVSNPKDLQTRKGLILQEFEEAVETLDIMSLYSYFFVNCAQTLYKDLHEISYYEANTFSDRLLLLIGNIMEEYFRTSKQLCKKTINMLIEITFQLVAIRKNNEAFKSAKIIEIISSRKLDGPNLSLSAMILLYLLTLCDEPLAEEEFLRRYKVFRANKDLIQLLRFLIFTISRLEDEDIAAGFLKRVSMVSSEIYPDLLDKNDFRERHVVEKVKSKDISSGLEQFETLLAGLNSDKGRTSQIVLIQNTFKKAYYSIAMKEGKSYQQKLAVLEKLMNENIQITPKDVQMIDNLVLKIENNDEFKNHIVFLESLVQMCKRKKNVNSICYLFLMLIFEEICKFSKKINDRASIVKLFLKIQFIKFPKSLTSFRQYKSLLIKYFPFYMMKNLSFLNPEDPIKDIVQKHKEFIKLFAKSSKQTQIDGIKINLINPLDAISSTKMEALIVTETENLENLFDMLRLEIEIWENFINQISNFDKQQKRSYQSMLRSIIFHSFLEKLPKLKKKKKTILGNFLHNLCIRNDQLVKLILSQGFDIKYIKYAVEYIDWFHVCLVYCDQLLSNITSSKKLHFYYRLLTATVKKYPARISKDVARNLILNHFAYVELNPEENKVVLESVKTLIQAFPSLNEEKKYLIKHYQKIQKELCAFDISYIYIDRLTKELEKINPN